MLDHLDDILRALHNAVIEAQKLTEQQHHRQLKRYFRTETIEESGKEREILTPETMTVQVPDLSPDPNKKWQDVEVPLLAIMPPSSLKIQDINLNFNVHIDGFGREEENKPGFTIANDQDKEKHKGPLLVDLRSQKDPGNLAEINITFVSADPPEAYFRIVEMLNKMVP